jgi:uncharacterized membrane protein
VAPHLSDSGGAVTAVLAERVSVRDTLRQRVDRVREAPGITILTLCCLAAYLVHSLYAQYTYRSTAFDLGIFDQAVRAYSHFQAPMVPLKGPGFNVFGDHFHPIIATIAPLYWIWDSPNVLLIVQAILMASAVPVVYRFARRRTGPRMSLVISAAYGFGWPVQALIDFDFHEIAFATPLLALAIDALDRRDDRKLLLWAVLLLFVREDMGILVVLLALLRLLQRRPPHWRAAALAVGGIVAYLITTTLIIPHFARGHGFAYGSQFDALGKNLPDAVISIVAHPWHALKLFFSPSIKTETLAYLTLPFALLFLRSRYAVLALPLLAERFFNSRGNLWQPHFHYNALPWLVLALATVDGAARLGLFRPTVGARRARLALAAWLVAVPVLLPFYTYSTHPYAWQQMRTTRGIQSQAALHAARAVVAHLPSNVCIEADNKLVPHLTNRDYVTLPDTQNGTADFIALDLAAPDIGGNPPAPKPAPVLAAAEKQGYVVIFRQARFVLLQSPHYTGPSSECHPLSKGKAG